MATEHAAQKVIREKGQTTCVYHKGQSLTLYCETCSDVMCVKCLSGLHRGHFVCDFNDVIPSMKTELRSYLNKNNRGRIQLDLESTETEIKKNASDFDGLCCEVKNQREKLKLEIDVKAEKVLETCKQMEEGNKKALTSFKVELQNRLEFFDDGMQQEYTDVLKTGSNLKVHDTLNEIRSKSKLQLMPVLAKASFHPNTNPHSYMDRYFGTMTSSAYRPLQYTFLPKIMELSTFQLKNNYSIKAICISSEDEAWVCNGETGEKKTNIQLINTNGEIQQTIPWELNVTDASVSPITKNLWVCSDGAVFELDVSMKSPASLLQTNPTYSSYKKVTCICVTQDDQVIVGGTEEISKYTKDGGHVISTRRRQSGHSIVYSPRKLAECCVTRNVAAIASSVIVVMNQDLVELFQRSDKKHLMIDLQYDTAGNLIIFRQYGQAILEFYYGSSTFLDVLSGSGKLLNTIEIKDCLMAASLDTNGVLWAGCLLSQGNVVKRLQYCKHDVA